MKASQLVFFKLKNLTVLPFRGSERHSTAPSKPTRIYDWAIPSLMGLMIGLEFTNHWHALGQHKKLLASRSTYKVLPSVQRGLKTTTPYFLFLFFSINAQIYLSEEHDH